MTKRTVTLEIDEAVAERAEALAAAKGVEIGELVAELLEGATGVSEEVALRTYFETLDTYNPLYERLRQ